MSEVGSVGSCGGQDKKKKKDDMNEHERNAKGNQKKTRTENLPEVDVRGGSGIDGDAILASSSIAILTPLFARFRRRR